MGAILKMRGIVKDFPGTRARRRAEQPARYAFALFPRRRAK